MIKTKIIKVAKDKQRSGTGFYNSPTYSNSSTNINVDSELSESSTNPVQNAVITNELNQIKADAVNTVSNTDNTLDISKSGNTVTINSKTWKFNENGDLIYDGTIIPNEVVTSILNADTATLETLTVTKAAHFFQLIIDEIKSTKGQILITAANAKLDKVTVRESDGDIFCYWKATDGSKTIYNQFVADDQVICQTFNVGTSSAATQNKFYWYRVYSVGTETIDGELYNYIHLDPNDKDANSNAIPAVGDEIALLGNRTNADRQAAIIISAYNNQYLDPTIQAPSIVQYSGINNWNLSTHRLNVISKSYNSFSGNFTTTAGENLENKFMPYFPINAPFYQYDYKMEIPQDTNPIRYNGENDIYSTPTFLNAGKYKFRVFINSASLSSSIEITSYGTTYPSSDLGNYSGIGLPSVLGRTDKTMKVGNATFYEYTATINITANGYYGLNYWENYQIYIPENDEGFETNFSKIEQTNTRITTTVNNINGQISTINQTAEQIEAKVDNVSVKIDSGQITLNGNTKVQGDLTISDATNGFTLTNDDNYNTIIKPQSIGEYADYSNREQSEQISITSNSNVLTTPNSQSSQKEPNAAQYFEVTYSNNSINKYNLTANEILNLTAFDDFNLLVKGFTAYNRRNYSRYYFSGGDDFASPPDYTPSTTSYNPKNHLRGYMKVEYEGTVRPPDEWNDSLFYFHLYSIDTRLSIYNSSGTEVGYVTLSGNTPALNYTFTAPSTDTYEIRSSTKIRFNGMFNNDDYNGARRRMDYVFRDYVQTNYLISVTRYLQSNEISNIIGYDGISLSLGNDNLIYMGKDSTNIKYGKNELLVDSTGIKKYAGLTTSQYQNESTIGTDTGLSYYKSEYAPLNGCVVRFISDGGNYYLQPRDEVIVLVNPQSGAKFYLGNPSQNIGRKVYMKIYQGRADAYITVTTTPNSSLSAFVNSSGRGSVTSITVNDRGVMFISVGDRWLTFISY